jgi:hypothetical protein
VLKKILSSDSVAHRVLMCLFITYTYVLNGMAREVKVVLILGLETGLPDGIFSNPKSKFG